VLRDHTITRERSDTQEVCMAENTIPQAELPSEEGGYLGVGIHREVIATDEAPAAVGPYSQAIRVDNTVFTSGQIPIDPATGKLVEGDITVQTRQVLNNLKAILEAAGAGLEHVVKTTVYLANLDDFPAMNQVYAEFFPESPPARSTLEAARLPLGALLEVDAIAAVP
jgi:2-iminobutanoate/2-iminopropanoate deaminase